MKGPDLLSEGFGILLTSFGFGHDDRIYLGSGHQENPISVWEKPESDVHCEFEMGLWKLLSTKLKESILVVHCVSNVVQEKGGLIERGVRLTEKVPLLNSASTEHHLYNPLRHFITG
ncbi:hypothetical protein AVEN_248575-1 [Araneus ventricosus]|uniref:Uncharacterized protein n=1 Tax=Araneus ventricosus TaxID=182803 RepID=A0A4Y2T7E0_ARAVE|nr:hypothetical protein AVEN_248575-1 [Araneus ventricosus]